MAYVVHVHNCNSKWMYINICIKSNVLYLLFRVNLIITDRLLSHDDELMIYFSASITWTACRTSTRPSSCPIRLCSLWRTILCWRTPCCPSETARASSPKMSTTPRSPSRECRPSTAASTTSCSPAPVSPTRPKHRLYSILISVWFLLGSLDSLSHPFMCLLNTDKQICSSQLALLCCLNHCFLPLLPHKH